MPTPHSANRFRALHAPGRLLILPNAWDAGSAAVIAACGAEAVATTSAGLAWSRGYPDGDALPPRVLHAAIREIRRAIDVPLTIDVEGGYSDEAAAVGELVAAVLDAGAEGINIEDGAGPPDLLGAKIAAARQAADRAGVDLFINARTDVYLRGLVPAGRAVETTLERARLYRDAGCDGLFVPCIAAADIRTVADGIGDLPLNIMALAGIPDAAGLRGLGVRRLSAGDALAAAALGQTRRLATAFLADGRSEPLSDGAIGYAEANALFKRG